MSYNLFPSVDENFDFPQDVRIQLAKSEELRNLVAPMSEIVRNTLTMNERWDGRTIYNTTRKKLETWDLESEVWVQYLDSTYTFPTPPAFWDENYDLPVNVRIQLAKSAELKYLVVPMDQTTRNSLSTQNKWNGRTIFNTTSGVLEVWSTETTSWQQYFNSEFMPAVPSWESWTPSLEYADGTLTGASPHNYTSTGKILKDGDLLHGMFEVIFDGAIDNGNRQAFAWVCLALPPGITISTNPEEFSEYNGVDGFAILDQTPVNNRKALAWISLRLIPFGNQSNQHHSLLLEYTYDFLGSQAKNYAENNSYSDVEWEDGCKIYGQFAIKIVN